MKEKLVFGLDIGTRSVVGTVGYKKQDKFVVVAQRIKEHDTRAMLDGQIHDIQKVGDTIREVKSQLEDAIGEKLSGVCIAAAGRMLRTVTTHVEMELDNRETTQEDIFNLISAGVEKAYEEFLKDNQIEEDMKFYCVGHSVVRYFLNGTQFTSLEGHKARNIGIDLIATFLPDEVVDSLYKSVEIAGLTVDNLTLEPIAAIQLAIPERFRMLNIALIDVGAGTSDISITNDGSILAYGMIPKAGDALTEEIAKACLVDFNEAEKIKKEADGDKDIEYFDIMLLPQKIAPAEVNRIIAGTIEQMASEVADKIRELNGGKSVSAVFVVGGGGKNKSYAEAVADKLGIARERVALRGEEVMQNIVFEENTKKDSLLVTPIGICLNYYEESNNFIFVSFNGSRIKMYDNNNLTVADVATQAQFPNDGLFPKRGDALNYTVNGKAKMLRGLPGEAAVITINDEPAFITSRIRANDVVRVTESTKGEAAKLTLEELEELGQNISVNVNGQKVLFPCFAEVNGELQSKFYDIKEGDRIEILNYYTVRQITDFMDVILEQGMNIYVNNDLADMDTKVYDNFTVNWTLEKLKSQREELEEERTKKKSGVKDASEALTYADLPGDEDTEDPDTEDADPEADLSEEDETDDTPGDSYKDLPEDDGTYEGPTPVSIITVNVNGAPVILRGKTNFVFVDIFDAIDFDLHAPKGKTIVTLLNGKQAQYMEAIRDGDDIEIYWEDM
ncbi:MAG: cell division protein FtsA [Lachnospiraceae bacterium]|nr:cell division protein FtsA [Lachnospiraceae bacterium]